MRNVYNSFGTCIAGNSTTYSDADAIQTNLKYVSITTISNNEFSSIQSYHYALDANDYHDALDGTYSNLKYCIRYLFAI